MDWNTVTSLLTTTHLPPKPAACEGPICADMGGVVTSMDRTYDAVMDKLRDSAPQVGMAMGVLFFVVGLVLGNFGIMGLGVVVALAGFVSRPAKS